MSASLHPAIDRGFEIAAATNPRAAARARGAAGLLTAALRRDGTPEVWSSSRLSRPGFPFEIAFCSHDPSLRYTTEVAPPAADPARRLARALRLLARLGAPPLPAPLAARLAALQDGARLRYGAWVGGRHDAQTDRYKLYVEAPLDATAPAADAANAANAAAASFAAEILGGPIALGAGAGREVRVDMIGVDPTAGRTEVYLRIEGMVPPEIRTLLAPAGLADRSAEVLAFLEKCARFPSRRELPCRVFGCSYSVAPEGGPTVFSLYTFANALFGGDGSIRRRLLALAETHGWDFPGYAELSAPLTERRDHLTCHGLFGLVVQPGAPVSITFGLTPPEPS